MLVKCHFDSLIPLKDRLRNTSGECRVFQVESAFLADGMVLSTGWGVFVSSWCLTGGSY